MQTLFRVTSDDRLHCLWVLLATTGLRSGEALGLKWEDIEWERDLLYVRRALQRQRGNGLVFVSPKTHRSSRPVHLPAGTVATLRRHQARQKTEQLAAGRPPDEGLVFTNARGGPLDPGNVLESFNRRLKQAGLPKRRVHDLRHSMATHQMTMGTNPRVVQEMLGHSTVNITLATYSHVMATLHEDASRKMDAFFPKEEVAS